MIRAAATLAALAGSLAVADGALSAQPLSAIPWLSESIRVERSPPPRRPDAVVPAPVPGTEEITVTPLGAINRDAVGLLSPAQTGFPRDLWGPATAEEVRAAILAHPADGPPAARALFRTLLLAETEPPPGPYANAPVLLARIDRLLGFGALDDAGALIARAGPDAPELFRRWFDIGILTNEAQGPCAALRQNPSLSPTLPARVFCLARGGDWNAAEITLTLGEEIGAIGTEEQPLLARFLDPALFEEAAEPPVPDPLTPLDFLMREAVGLPRPPGPLPVAFLHHDLDANAPLRSRIEAAERLAVSDGIAPGRLMEAYRGGAPAASGGVWDRAAAVQALDTALADGREIGAALVEAEARLTERGLRGALAGAYADELAAVDPAALEGPARVAAFELLLLAGRSEAARRVAPKPMTPEAATRLAVAGAGGRAQPNDALEQAAVTAFASRPAGLRPDSEPARALAEGRIGEAILDALATLGGGGAVDPEAMREALLVLRRAGQETAARRIAVEILIAESG